MSEKAITIISGATLVTPNGLLESGAVVLQGGRIIDIAPDPPASYLLNREEVELISVNPHTYLTPGLIDLQNNGGLGCDFNHCTLQEAFQFLKALPRYGVTRIYPTLISASAVDMVSALGTLEEVVHLSQPHHTQVSGIHLEGPFLNPNFHGAHPAEVMTEATVEDILPLLSPNVKLMTLAPEQDPEGEVTRHLVKQEIRVLAGHTGASIEAILKAKVFGLSGFTHLFNAMSPFHHRDPGLLSVSLIDDDLFTTCIADGQHLHPFTLRLILKAKPQNRVVLVSDSMALAGEPDGTSTLFGNQPVTQYEQQAINHDHRLAGSTAFLDQCVRNLVQWDILPFTEAVRLATETPASLMGLENIGKIQLGHWGDLVLWEKETLSIQASWIQGQPVYQGQAFQKAASV